MKTDNTTYFYYRGTVDVSIKINGNSYSIKKLNNGAPFLKYAFAKLLADDIDDLCDDRTKKEPVGYYSPKWLEIWKSIKISDNKYQEPQSFTTKSIEVKSTLINQENGIYTGVELKAYVPFDYLQEEVDPVKEEFEGNKFYLYLFSNEDTHKVTNDGRPKLEEAYHKLAELEIDPLTLSYITPGTTATITWIMQLLPQNEYLGKSKSIDPYIKYTFAKLMGNKFDDLSEKDIPKYLIVQKIENYGTSKQSIIDYYSNKVRLTSNLVDIENGLYTGVCFSAPLTYNTLLKPIDQSDTESKYCLCLISEKDKLKRMGEDYHVLARMFISTDALVYLSPAISATVTWTIKLLNKDEVDE